MAADTLRKRFETIYADEADAIYRFCFFRTSDTDAALDIMQDTFVRFWDAFSRDAEGIQNERALLFTIARHRIIDWYRKKRSVSLDELMEGNASEAFLGYEDDLSLAYEGKYLMEKIRELDPDYQQAIYLRFVEGLDPKDIALIVGQSANVISVRIHRGLKQLKKIAGYDVPEYGT